MSRGRHPDPAVRQFLRCQRFGDLQGVGHRRYQIGAGHGAELDLLDSQAQQFPDGRDFLFAAQKLSGQLQSVAQGDVAQGGCWCEVVAHAWLVSLLVAFMISSGL